MNYYIGWDVGAWKCINANDASCDALFVISEDGTMGHYRDNLSHTIQSICDIEKGKKLNCLIENWFKLSKLDHRYSPENNYCIAIDTPLGWPSSFGKLLNWQLDPKWNFNESQSNMQNILLFRRTERELGSSFSAVVDAIGSQSTKGMALLCALEAKMQSWGVWSKENITLLEAYPKSCLRSVEFITWMSNLGLGHDIREWYRPVNQTTKKRERALLKQDDTFDAAVCACLAKAFIEKKPPLKQPPANDENSEKGEGWIFYPEGELLKASLLKKYVNIVNTRDVNSFDEAVKRLSIHVSQLNSLIVNDKDLEG